MIWKDLNYLGFMLLGHACLSKRWNLFLHNLALFIQIVVFSIEIVWVKEILCGPESKKEWQLIRKLQQSTFFIFGRCKNRITKESKGKVIRESLTCCIIWLSIHKYKRRKLFKRITPIYSFCDLEKGMSYGNLVFCFDNEKKLIMYVRKLYKE